LMVVAGFALLATANTRLAPARHQLATPASNAAPGRPRDLRPSPRRQQRPRRAGVQPPVLRALVVRLAVAPPPAGDINHQQRPMAGVVLAPAWWRVSGCRATGGAPLTMEHRLTEESGNTIVCRHCLSATARARWLWSTRTQVAGGRDGCVGAQEQRCRRERWSCSPLLFEVLVTPTGDGPNGISAKEGRYC
jgi:hypothetical protein